MKHDDRIQAALDGELTPSDAQRLQLECVSSPEAKLQMDELKQVDSALRGLKQHEAPQNLRDQVMRQVRLRQAVHLAQVRARGGVFQEWWQAWFGGRPAFQVGLGFALGVLLLVPLTGSPWRQFVDPGSVSGTLAGRVRQAEPLRFKAEGVSGSLQVRMDGDLLTLSMDLTTSEPAVAKVDFSAPLAGLASFVSDSPSTSKLEYSEQTLSLWHAGTAHVEVHLHAGANPSPKLHFSVLQNGFAVYEADVP